MNTAHHPPKWWYRYVDDSHVCIAREHLREFHSHLDFNTPDLKQKKTKTDLLHFWNQDNRNPFGTTKTSVYRKATHTDQFIRSCQRTTAPTNQSQTQRGLVTLPYIQGTSERIPRTLNQFNINVAHKPVTTSASIKKQNKTEKQQQQKRKQRRKDKLS